MHRFSRIGIGIGGMSSGPGSVFMDDGVTFDIDDDDDEDDDVTSTISAFPGGGGGHASTSRSLYRVQQPTGHIGSPPSKRLPAALSVTIPTSRKSSMRYSSMVSAADVGSPGSAMSAGMTPMSRKSSLRSVLSAVSGVSRQTRSCFLWPLSLPPRPLPSPPACDTFDPHPSFTLFFVSMERVESSSNGWKLHLLCLPILSKASSTLLHPSGGESHVERSAAGVIQIARWVHHEQCGGVCACVRACVCVCDVFFFLSLFYSFLFLFLPWHE
jgi:hypothetical protein